MALYPSTPAPSYPLNISRNFKTLVSDFDSGSEQRRRLWRFPKRSVSLNYKNITLANRDILAAFFNTYFGTFTEFYWYDPLLRNWTDEYVGRGDGATTTFNLHSKTTTTGATLKIYVDGIITTVTTDYTFVSGGGTEGADRITFTAGHIPSTGQLITSDFNGYLRIKARFSEDGLSEEQANIHTLFNIQVGLTEIQW